MTTAMAPEDARSILHQQPEPKIGDTENDVERRLTCKSCNLQFDFTKGEATFYSRKNLTIPNRCKKCRDQRKAESESSGSKPAHAKKTKTKTGP